MDTPGSYTCLEWDFATTVTDETRRNAQNPLKPDRTATEYATDKVLLGREKRIADALFNTTTFSSQTVAVASLTGGAGAQWSDYVSSSPRQDVNAVRKILVKAIGHLPNTMIVGYDVHNALVEHPAIIELLKYTQVPNITNAMLANMFQVEKYLVGNSIYTDAEEGTTATYSFNWGDYVMLAYVNPSPALESPSLGYIVQSDPFKIERYREDQEKQDVYTALVKETHLITCTDAAYLLSDVIA